MVWPAAVVVWLVAALGPGLSFSAEDNSHPGFNLCSHCFYRQTPPQGASAGESLHPLCHKLPGGQTFATLSKPTCDTAVYSAFHLSHGWTEREELVVSADSHPIAVPALLRGSRDPSHPVLAADSPLQHWDSTVTTLVQSSITPQCSALGGDLYILTGVGHLGAAEECQMKPLWSAVCCAVPEGKGGFSIGLISETGKGERQVSVKELEEILGVTELFSKGCQGADAEAVGTVIDLHSEGRPTVSLGEEEEADEVTQGASANAVKSVSSSKEQHDMRHSGAVRSHSPDSSCDYETVHEQETDSNSSSTLVYILSTTFSILTFPVRSVVSTLTQLLGQVIYVLQEDLGVLCTLPGDTFSVLYLLTSDLLSWMGSAAEMTLDIGDTCFSSVQYCTSSMLGALMSSCHTGVTGIGTLAGDTVGIFSDSLDNAWWLTRFFGGWLWEQSEDYVGTVVSEMGCQAQAVGGGLGNLAWRSGNGVGNVFKLGKELITGVVYMFTGDVTEPFEQQSE
uniref:INO80 complex subunit E n=1 Tax=Monopterus albus TaxID=43700 RepID=A0A3Q3RE07_MONAL